MLELEAGAALSVGPNEVVVEDKRDVVELELVDDEELAEDVVE